MGRKRTPGLYKRGDTWHIDKQLFGYRVCESTGATDLAEAERFLARRTEELRQANVYGVRPKRTFREAAIKYVQEHQHKASLRSDIGRIKILDRYIGSLTLDTLHMGVLQPFIEGRKKEGVKTRTINHGLKIVRQILNLAATEWIDEHGLTWLANAVRIKLLPEFDLRKPYPLNWEEQERLFAKLPLHLRQMALFAVNTGCRDAEICNLKWEWERKIPKLNTSVFIIPATRVKNRMERLVVLNKIAATVIEEVRGEDPNYVFTYNGKPITRMLNSAWLKARERAGLSVRVHDLKHTFGRRLRAAGVSLEDRQDLLGHKSNKITTHYSEVEFTDLLKAANKVCFVDSECMPDLLLLEQNADKDSLDTRVCGYDGEFLDASSRKSPATAFLEFGESHASY